MRVGAALQQPICCRDFCISRAACREAVQHGRPCMRAGGRPSRQLAGRPPLERSPPPALHSSPCSFGTRPNTPHSRSTRAQRHGAACAPAGPPPAPGACPAPPQPGGRLSVPEAVVRAAPGAQRSAQALALPRGRPAPSPRRPAARQRTRTGSRRASALSGGHQALSSRRRRPAPPAAARCRQPPPTPASNSCSGRDGVHQEGGGDDPGGVPQAPRGAGRTGAAPHRSPHLPAPRRRRRSPALPRLPCPPLYVGACRACRTRCWRRSCRRCR